MNLFVIRVGHVKILVPVLIVVDLGKQRRVLFPRNMGWIQNTSNVNFVVEVLCVRDVAVMAGLMRV